MCFFGPNVGVASRAMMIIGAHTLVSSRERHILKLDYGTLREEG